MQSVTRLITLFQPTHYHVELTIDRIGRQYSGKTTITGESHDGRIVVHAKNLVIDSTTVDGKPATAILGEFDELSIEQPGLVSGNHVVEIQYHATISENMNGLYPCHFTHEGIEKELLITQFESHYARNMFPCVDEPEAKATFDVTVTTERNIVVLGNMPAKDQFETGENQTTVFETTPKMSTYLLALVMGELQKKSGHTKSGVDVSVWATPAQSPESLDYALDQAIKVTEFFDDYFGVPYPLPKSDHVAVPDFDAGAMENWGLVTYREVALLAHPDTSTLDSRQYVTTVVAHELSHQWFGNLVTMKWWNNLWLNESFASIMEYVAPDALHPEWHVWSQFASSESVPAFRRDSIDGVQSVQVEVSHPDEISSLFDAAIVYAKGGCLLRMLRDYIGEETFRAGLTDYFTKFAYQNTDQTDLWTALGTAAGRDIASMMNTWISQPGYPIVTITRQETSVTLRQKRFFIGTHQPSEQLWPIPLVSPETNEDIIFDQREQDFATTQPIDFTSGPYSQFITHYDDMSRSAILSRIKSGTLGVDARVRFLNEQVLLSRAGVIETASIFDVLDAFRSEYNEFCWQMIGMVLSDIKRMVDLDSDEEKKLKSFVGSLARAQYDRLGWDAVADEPRNDTQLRSHIIGHMLYSEDEAVIAEAIKRFDAKPLTDLDPELRDLLLTAKVRFDANETLIDSLINTAAKTHSTDIRDTIRDGLTSTRDATVIEKLIVILKDRSIIRPQDTMHWVIYLLSNRYARERTWQWLRNEWPWIEATFKDDKSYDYYPRYAGQMLESPQHLAEYKAFFSPMIDVVALKRAIEMGIINLEANVEFLTQQSPAVRQKLMNL